MNFIMIYPFLPENMKIEKVEKLVAFLHNTKNCYSDKNFKSSIQHGAIETFCPLGHILV